MGFTPFQNGASSILGQLSVQGFLGSVVFLWTTLLPLLQKLPYKKKGSGHFLLSGMFEDMEFCLQRQKYFPRSTFLQSDLLPQNWAFDQQGW